jgi:hypothetical protein
MRNSLSHCTSRKFRDSRSQLRDFRSFREREKSSDGLESGIGCVVPPYGLRVEARRLTPAYEFLHIPAARD